MNSNQEKTKEEIVDLAMRDELFTPESISLEPCGQSLTVRLPDKNKHFNSRSCLTIPARNEDSYIEIEYLFL